MCTEFEDLVAGPFEMKHCVLSKSKRVHTYQAKSNSQYSYYVKTRLVNNAVLSRSSFNLFELRSLQSCNRTDQKNYRRYDETMELSVVLPVCRASTSILGERKSRSLSNNASILSPRNVTMMQANA